MSEGGRGADSAQRSAFYVLRFYVFTFLRSRAREKRAAPHFHAGRPPGEGEGSGVIPFLCFPFFRYFRGSENSFFYTDGQIRHHLPPFAAQMAHAGGALVRGEMGNPFGGISGEH